MDPQAAFNKIPEEFAGKGLLIIVIIITLEGAVGYFKLF